MTALTYTMALLMGFTGSLHCAGMCGPIMWVMPFQAFRGAKKIAALALYHAARVSVYAMLAVTLHSFRSLFDPRIQQYISISLGAVLLAVGILSFFPGRRLALSLPWSSAVKQQLARIVGRPGLGVLALSGMLNGLLPCGLVYMALSGAMAVHTAGEAALMMYAFGAGTLPMLLSITLLRTKIPGGAYLRKLVPVIVFSFGCLFMLRGMNLGIPYLSPRVAVGAQGIHSCCCHKH